MIILAETAEGLLGFGGPSTVNELVVRSKINDPPKVRLEAPEGSLHKGLVTFGTRRPDGRYEELVTLAGKQDERYRGNPYHYTGEAVLSIRQYDPAKTDDQQFKAVALFRHDGITPYVPVVGSSTLSDAPAFLRSANGQYEAILQYDEGGHLVIYDRWNNRRAVWSSKYGTLA